LEEQMKKWILGAALATLAFPCGAFAQSKDALVGTWKLVSATDTFGKGEIKAAFGKNPTGFLTYTQDGRMMAIISHEGRKPLSVPDYIAAPLEERAEAFATFIAYAGTYTLQSGRVIHHVQVASLQNLFGSDQVRTVVNLEGGRLTLRTPPFLKDGKMVTTELTWERVTEKN
jgi:lipocalin-like protein